MSLIHKFKQGENYFVLDVNTGAVHIVDELVYDLVDFNSFRPQAELVAEFGDKYGADIVEEAYDEIKTLIDEEILYTNDQYEDTRYAAFFPSSTSSGSSLVQQRDKKYSNTKEGTFTARFIS